MTDKSPEPNERESRLLELMAGWLEAARLGQAPPREGWLAQHPDLADDLKRFLDNQDWLERLKGHLPTSAETPAGRNGPTSGGESARAAGAPPGLGKVPYFGDYELLAEIARGGMGVVCKARQVSLNRIVALKMILLVGPLAGARELQRFKAEAEAVANLDHPNIVPVYEVGEHRGQPYFSMKFVEGGSLADRVSELVQDPQRTAALLARVARAVHFAHQRGILHRDLKPANILIDRNGTPLVSDFGLARRLEGESGLTSTGAIVGTPGYIAPEQARAERQLTTAADVWALGAMLYECLTGRPPFQANNPVETLQRVIGSDPAWPRTLNPRADRDLGIIALKCLRKDPAQRYESAGALADDLERWLRGEPIRARSVGLLERSCRCARRNPAVAALTLAVVLALVLGTAAASFLVVAARHAAMRAEAERRDAEAAHQRAVEEKKRADENARRAREEQEKAKKEKKTSQHQAERAEKALYARMLELAQRAWQQADPVGAEPASWQMREEHRLMGSLCLLGGVTTGPWGLLGALPLVMPSPTQPGQSGR
jgi:hypothetical protein